MELEGEANGKSCESGNGIEHTKKTQSTVETVRAEIFSFLDLIAGNVMKLKAESNLRISYYSSKEIQIHMDNMRSEVTTLLQMMDNVQNMEIPGEELATEKMGEKAVQIRTDDKGESSRETEASKNSDFRLKSILKILETLKQIHTVLLDEVLPKISTSGLEGEEASGRNEVSPMISTSRETKLEMDEALKSKSTSELFKETGDSLTEIEVETKIKARETEEAPQKLFLDTVLGANGMGEVSRRISTSGLEIEEANEMGGEDTGMDVAWLSILSSGLGIEEDKEAGLESNGRNEVSPRISTCTKTKLEIEEDKQTCWESNGRNEVSPRISTCTETKLEIVEAKGMREEANMGKVLTEEESFDLYRRGWVSSWSASCGAFTEPTTLSPMQFTHCTPRDAPFAAFVANTLQMYSIKITEIKEDLGLKWPLKVYGVVAARDTVDCNRNILFSRQRGDYQELNEQDPYLRLTGPSRAIVKEEPVCVEIELKVKGRTQSEDRVLMSKTWYYSYRLCTLYTPLAGKYCTLVLSSEELGESVQATIVGVHLTKGKSELFKYGGRVVCSSPPRRCILPHSKHMTAPSFRQVVLQDGAMDVCSNGYLALSRNVVSVELCRRLEVHIYAYSQSRGIAEHGCVSIKAQDCNVTQHKCCLGDSELEISVAWSWLVKDKQFISSTINV